MAAPEIEEGEIPWHEIPEALNKEEGVSKVTESFKKFEAGDPTDREGEEIDKPEEGKENTGEKKNGKKKFKKRYYPKKSRQNRDSANTENENFVRGYDNRRPLGESSYYGQRGGRAVRGGRYQSPREEFYRRGGADQGPIPEARYWGYYPPPLPHRNYAHGKEHQENPEDYYYEYPGYYSYERDYYGPNPFSDERPKKSGRKRHASKRKEDSLEIREKVTERIDDGNKENNRY